jgi:hypothetical protein
VRALELTIYRAERWSSRFIVRALEFTIYRAGAGVHDLSSFVGSDSGFGIGKSTSAREDEKGQDCLHGRVGLLAEAPRSSADAASPGRCRAAVC